MAAPEIASEYSQQIVESEHLLKALLEQPNGLARRIISKAGSDATRLLDKTDAFIRRQPRVSGDTAQQVIVVVGMHSISAHIGCEMRPSSSTEGSIRQSSRTEGS